MSAHTPRPWKAVYVGCGDWDLSGPTTREDWTLAAAAPDLLEALKDIAGTDPVDAALDPQRAVRIARAAIKAVEGEKE